MDAVRAYEEVIKDNIEYAYLIQDKNIDQGMLDEIVALMLETVCTRRKVVRIAGDASPDLGKFVNFEEQPKDLAVLRGVLWDEKYSRDHFDCGNIKEHIETLSGKPGLVFLSAEDRE